MDVNLHPIAWAGWVGLLVTCLNLLPMGQLDGGHTLYALIGRRAWPIARLTAVAMLVMGVVAWSGWFIWAVLPLLFGLRHPPPLNDHTPLDTRRKLVGVLVLIVFVLVFTPVPLTVVWPPGS
jgi:membrane-associated protease RseP (regulator of RpoE activity)